MIATNATLARVPPQVRAADVFDGEQKTRRAAQRVQAQNPRQFHGVLNNYIPRGARPAPERGELPLVRRAQAVPSLGFKAQLVATQAQRNRNSNGPEVIA